MSMKLPNNILYLIKTAILITFIASIRAVVVNA